MLRSTLLFTIESISECFGRYQVNVDEFVKQIQQMHKRMAELQQNASQLPLQQQSQLTPDLEKLIQICASKQRI